jgi:hypothetical protein
MVASSRARNGLVSLCVGYLIAAACSSPIPDANPAPDAGLDASTPDASSFGGSACAECLRVPCEAELEICAGDPECASHLACRLTCPVDVSGSARSSCVSACPQPSGAVGSDARSALDACFDEHSQTSCTAACAAGDGGSVCAHPLLCQNCVASSFPDECGKCWFDSCCETFHPCNNQPECVAIEDCFSACPGGIASCFEQCFAQHPSFVDLWLADHACFTHFCSEPCSGPSRLDEKCDSCINGPCVASRLSCELHEGCFVLSICIGECGSDSPCVEACHTKADPVALELFETHHLCKVLKCNGACQL